MNSYRRPLAIVFAAVGWFALIAQCWLMLDSRVEPVAETIVRFFSFFTILTNTMVALFFTLQAVGKSKVKTGTLTAITIYITVVGLVYHVILRQLWTPTGLQQVVDELLHSVVPVLTIGYWYRYEDRHNVSFTQITMGLVFPLVYLVYILIRGFFSGFYPYPFVDVSVLGFANVMSNAVGLVILFTLLAFVYVYIGRKLR
ncbi:Pr6Pr family membrane protein [Achromobacter sp.]|uniref:Pr6Pr family membrane protein n=1 Tax=Achromobacter sp. TaxID=134375 RepID=UPI003C73397F